MAEIRFETKLERRNLPDGLSDEQKANYKVPIEADADLLRYGLYGQDGIIRNFGNGLAHLIAGPNFTIRSGKGAIHGRTFIVDSAGITYNVGTSSTVVYFVVYAEINMSVSSAERAEIVFAWQTGFYPVIPFGDDLTQHNTGVARAELYRFQASGGVISNVQQNFHIISYAKYYIPGLVQIPSSVDIEIVSIDGNGINVVEQTGILYPGWYMVELSAGGGGGNAGYSNNPIYGGNGGYLRSTFFVSHKANYKLMAGGGGEGGEGTGKSQESCGGGGGSVLDIPQLGIVFIATGGGGAGSAVGGDNRGGGGGGGGYGGGGSGRVTSGGAGGGASGGYGGRSGGGAGGGMNGGSGYGTGGFGGGASGNGGAYIINGENGGNNLNNELGGGAKGGFGSGIGSYGSNGFARIYRLVDPD